MRRTFWTHLLAAIGVAVGLTGCKGAQLPELLVSSASPSVLPLWVGGQVEIAGAGFWPVTEVDPDTGEARVVDGRFSVQLVPSEGSGCAALSLDSVVWGDLYHLSGVVPPLSDPGCEGSYALQITDPRGRVVTSPSPLLSLTSSWPDHLRVMPGTCQGGEAPDADVDVGSARTWMVQVVSPDGAPVPVGYAPSGIGPRLDQLVSVSVESLGEEPFVQVASTTLVDAEVPQVATQNELVGRLSAGGCAEFTLEGLAPGRVDLSALSLEQGQDSLARSVPDESSWFRVELPAAERLELVVSSRVLQAGQLFDVGITALDSNGQVVMGLHEDVTLLSTNGSLRIFPPGEDTSACGSPAPEPYPDSWVLPMVDGQFQGVGCFTLVQALPGGQDTSTQEVVYLSAFLVDGLGAVSEPIFLSPAEGQEVLPSLSESKVEVGVPFDARVAVVDRYGNRVGVDLDDLSAPEDRTGTLLCPDRAWDPIQKDVIFPGCVLTGAREDNRFTVVWSRTPGVVEFSSLPGPVASIAFSPLEESYVAGEAFPVEVEVRDPYSNVVTDARGKLTLYDNNGHLTEISETFAGGRLDTQVTLNVAGANALIAVLTDLSQGEDAALPLTAQSEPFQVRPGPFELLTVSLSGTTLVQAGEVFPIGFETRDAFGNLITDFVSEEGFEIGDSTNTLKLMEGPTFSGGRGSALAHIELVTANAVVRVTELGTDVTGEVGGLQVVAAALARLSLRVDTPYVWLGEPFEIDLWALDAFNNLVTDFSEPVALLDETNTLEPSTTEPFVGGRLRQRVTLGKAIQQTTLSARFLDAEVGDEIWPSVMVVQDCGVLGPSAELTLFQAKDNLFCLDRGSASVVADARESVATGVNPSYGWISGVGGVEDWALTPQATYSFEYDEPGRYDVGVLVMDGALCADFATTPVYVGIPDGTMTGPITLTPCRTSVSAGAGGASATTAFALAATTCEGEPFNAGTQLTLNTSYGRVQLKEGDADAAPGLQVQWEAGTQVSCSTSATAAPFWLTVADEVRPGEVHVVVSGADGAADGEVALAVTNDKEPPRVVELHPTGMTRGVVAQAWARFSEPILAQTLVGNTSIVVEVDGVPLDPTTDFSVAWEAAGQRAIFTFDGAGINVDSSVIDITLPSRRTQPDVVSVLDVVGLPLDGDLDGAIEDEDSFRWRFGAVEDTSPPEVLSCVPGATAFSPDGQDGPGLQSDQLSIGLDLEDDQQVLRYSITVVDVRYDVVFSHMYQVGDVLSLDWVWDGKRDGGLPLENATYWFEVDAFDGSGNRTLSPCVGWFEVASALSL